MDLDRSLGEILHYEALGLCEPGEKDPRPPDSVAQERRHIMPPAIGIQLSRLRTEKRCALRRCDQGLQRLAMQ